MENWLGQMNLTSLNKEVTSLHSQQRAVDSVLSDVAQSGIFFSVSTYCPLGSDKKNIFGE